MDNQQEQVLDSSREQKHYSPLISRLECGEKMTSTFCTAIWVAQRPPREHRREVRQIQIVDK